MENEKTCIVSFLGFNSSGKLDHGSSFLFCFLNDLKSLWKGILDICPVK